MALATYRISNGPSKMDLMLGLFDSKQMGSRPVTFIVNPTKYNQGSDDGDASYLQERMSIDIDSVAKEDGSGESWCIEGCVHPRADSGLAPYNYTRVKIYFDTRSRKGHLSFDHRKVIEAIVS